MKLTTLAKNESGRGHSIDVSLLTGGWVLDAGCRYFDFTKDILRLQPKSTILCLDPDPQVFKHRCAERSGVIPIQAALHHDPHVRHVMMKMPKGPQGTFVMNSRYKERRQDRVNPPYKAVAVTLKNLMRMHKIKEFDVIKLDIEGAEYDILLNWPGPIAKQITIEFHDFLPGRNPFPNDPNQFYIHAWRYLKWYDVVRHKLDGPLWAKNYWDTLLIRSDLQ